MSIYLSSARRLLDFVVALLAFAALAPVWLAPWTTARRLARAYGGVVFFYCGKERRTSMINLRRVYGPAINRRVARSWTLEVFKRQASAIADGLQFARRIRTLEQLREICRAEDPGLAERLALDPRPKILVAGHLGSWELALMAAGLFSAWKGLVVARRIDNPFVDRLIRGTRFWAGGTLVEKRGAVEKLLRGLRSGCHVALLLDENGSRHGPFVPFFGRLASSRKTAALLSLLTGCPVVLGAAVPDNEDGVRFLYRLALFEPASYRTHFDPIRQMTADLFRTFETWVSDAPLCWRWIHWRWKNRPDGTVETYTRWDLAEAFK
ncbi:MAG: lysophospholipid acyltransferase family protein [Acidobacteriota bacterium]